MADKPASAPIAETNRPDVEGAQARMRTTTLLVLSDKMRSNMVDGLRTSWRDTARV